MITIPTGQYLDYAFQLPKDHPPGLYWYHPHHHGSTAVQAVSGMAGGVIVTGDIDEVPEEVRKGLEFIFAEDMSQVLAAALEAVPGEGVVTATLGVAADNATSSVQAGH